MAATQPGRTLNYVQLPGPLFERYNEAFEPDDPKSIVEIYLPVQRKAS